MEHWKPLTLCFFFAYESKERKRVLLGKASQLLKGKKNIYIFNFLKSQTPGSVTPGGELDRNQSCLRSLRLSATPHSTIYRFVKDLCGTLLFIHREEKLRKVTDTWRTPWERETRGDAREAAVQRRSHDGGRLGSTPGFANDPECHGERRLILWRLEMDVNIACAEHHEVWCVCVCWIDVNVSKCEVTSWEEVSFPSTLRLIRNNPDPENKPNNKTSS